MLAPVPLRRSAPGSIGAGGSTIRRLGPFSAPYAFDAVFVLFTGWGAFLFSSCDGLCTVPLGNADWSIVMDLTVCRAGYDRRSRYERLVVITDRALVFVGPAKDADADMKLAALVVGGFGALAAAESVTGGGPRTRLNLQDESTTPALGEMKATTRCLASEVPDDLHASDGWPKLEADCEVVFYPRVVIESVRLSRLGRLRAFLCTSDPDLDVRINLGSIRKARAALQRWRYREEPALTPGTAEYRARQALLQAKKANPTQPACSHDYQQDPEYPRWKKCTKCGATLRTRPVPDWQRNIVLAWIAFVVLMFFIALLLD